VAEIGDAAVSAEREPGESHLRPVGSEAIPGFGAEEARRPRSTSGLRRRTFRQQSRVGLEYAVLVSSALLLASLIRAFLGLAFWIPSPSMDPTLQIGDRVVVSRMSYRLHEPHRGDIIVFQNPGWVAPPKQTVPVRVLRGLGEFVGVGQPRDKNYIKRIIGLPGETVEGKDGAVWIDGKPLTERYLPLTVRTEPFAQEKIPPGQYWVMGDNRENSCDSRCMSNPDGERARFIQLDAIVGRAFVRVWPLSRMGKP
jgi:signal peptidase I